jgi:hypothetical protein
MSSDEMPPEWMWPLDDAIVEWMDRIREERDEKYGRGDRDREEKRETVPMTSNELARGRR